MAYTEAVLAPIVLLDTREPLRKFPRRFRVGRLDDAAVSGGAENRAGPRGLPGFARSLFGTGMRLQQDHGMRDGGVFCAHTLGRLGLDPHIASVRPKEF